MLRPGDRGPAVIVVSHDMNEVLRFADRVAVLYSGGLAGVHRVGEADEQALLELMTTGRSVRVARRTNGEQP